MRVCNPSRTACHLSGHGGAVPCMAWLSLGLPLPQEQGRPEPADTPLGAPASSGDRKWALPGRGRLLVWLPALWLPVPSLGLLGPCFTEAPSLSCTRYLWASMMSSGSPLPTPQRVLLLTSGPRAWQLSRAGSHFPLKSWSSPMGSRLGPLWVPNPSSLTPGSTIRAGSLVTC